MGQSLSLDNLVEGPWTEDIKQYPGSEEHMKENKSLYNFDYKGYKCKLRRNENFVWGCLVKLPVGHPDKNKTHSQVSPYIETHGTLTHGSGDGTFGFHCGQRFAGDIIPTKIDEQKKVKRSRYAVYSYKDYAYAKKECKNLAYEFYKRQQRLRSVDEAKKSREYTKLRENNVEEIPELVSEAVPELLDNSEEEIEYMDLQEDVSDNPEENGQAEETGQSEVADNSEVRDDRFSLWSFLTSDSGEQIADREDREDR